jgi:hypothetical protein
MHLEAARVLLRQLVDVAPRNDVLLAYVGED